MLGTGVIADVTGHIAQVRFRESPPRIHDILTLAEDSEVVLEVVSSAGPDLFYCMIMTPEAWLTRGAQVVNTNKQLSVPVGKMVLGRAFDVFGRAHDRGDKVQSRKTRSLFAPPQRSLEEIVQPTEVMETGIKAIDFFTPILKGGKTAFVGGAGIGKTVILTEMINRIVVVKKGADTTAAVFAAVGERSREAHELYHNLKKGKVLKNTSLVLGQMGENPAVRWHTAYAGATIAEYFRDDMQQDVLFFMDNIFRFAQAGYELSTLMNAIPSEDGYQPTLAQEMSSLNERLTSSTAGSITSFYALFVPSDDMTDSGVRSVFPYLDTMVILSREVFQQGRFPAVDLLESTSAALNPEIIGKERYAIYIRAKQLLERAASLDRIVSLVGLSELSQENRTLYERSQRLINYMSQDMFVSADQTGATAEFVPLVETFQTVEEIIDGKYDDIEPDRLKYIGSIKNLKLKVQEENKAAMLKPKAKTNQSAPSPQ